MSSYESNLDHAVEHARFLDHEGVLVRSPPHKAADLQDLIAGYKAMVRTRMFDEKAVALQRTGRLGTYASSLGQEAIGVGVAQTMRSEDVLLPSFREQSAQLLRGVTMTELLLYWGGDERGSDFTAARWDFPISIPVASHFPHAAGAALSFKLRKEPRVAVAMAGDGATSKGDFYEAMNMAGVWKLPVVFVISNNQWAISVRREDQTAAVRLADKAVAAGIPGEQIDGNDLIAVRVGMQRVITRARDGDGPSLLECITYRLGDHTTADDASRYRDAQEVSPHWKAEPVARLRSYLVAKDAWSKPDEQNLIQSCRADIDAAAEEYLATPPQNVTAMFDNLQAELSNDTKSQKFAALKHEEAGHA